MKTIVAAAMLLALTPALACAADILTAKMQPVGGGSASVHYQTTTHEACTKFLEMYREARESGTQVSLTMRNPDFTGIVLDAHCIDKNGKVHS
jgi:hypothetical protein